MGNSLTAQRMTRVLIVEDEKTQRRLLRAKLENAGYAVLEAVDGREGWQISQDNPDIRLVITDLVMPNMDGFQLIEQLRKSSHYIYIIVISSLDDRESVVKALTLGADDFLHKPFFQQELNLRLLGAQRLLKLEGQDELIFSMARLAGSRSGETGGHLLRVREYCRILATDLAQAKPELNITLQIAEEIAQVSPLHDIGKVGVPDSILHKPDKLTSEEFEIMKGHAAIGGDLLWDIYEQFGSPYILLAYEITMYHHERWDGSGYPQGLKEENIPFAARIMAFADVFDALVSKRCYKEASQYIHAKNIVLQEKGRHFDPAVVDAYLRHENEWVSVMEKAAVK